MRGSYWRYITVTLPLHHRYITVTLSADEPGEGYSLRCIGLRPAPHIAKGCSPYALHMQARELLRRSVARPAEERKKILRELQACNRSR